MSNKIAIIYEGVKAEKELFENIGKTFFSANTEITVFTFPADGNIYMLWERLKKDDFETDVISIVKEMCKSYNIENAEDIKASEFSEIYLFFDYDIHNNNLRKEHRQEDVLLEMFQTFNNETEYGKLYISYPMVESIKDISFEKRDYNTFYITVDESRDYKALVSQGPQEYSNYDKITREMWLAVCDASKKRASLIVTFNSMCEYVQFIEVITQNKIYEMQREHYVKNNSCIAVLNSIPLFLLEYFKEEFWNEAIQENVEEYK